MKIFDTFMFFNELDLLELRLMELYDHVDYFVLVEGNKTHTDKPKEFIFEQNKDRFKQWLPKIIHIKVEDFPPDVPNNAQFLENYHRNQISRGLVGIAEPGDKIMVSDVDEIPNMEIVKQHLDYPGWIHFKCDLFYYYVNNQTANGFGGVVMSPYELMTSPQQMRMMAIRKSAWWGSGGNENIVVNAGWHYSYLCGGDAERVKFKAANILEGHNTEDIVGSVENVAEKIKNHKDLYNRRSRRYEQSIVDISNNKPKSLDAWLKKHPEYFCANHYPNKLTIGILSWKDHQTLRNTLESYKQSRLLDYPKQIFIFFNEINDEDRKIAKEYNIKYYGAETNLGIAGGYKKMLEYVEQPNYLFLENDWMIREDAFDRVVSQLQDAEKYLSLANVVRLRHRREPGNPLWTKQFKGNELSRPEHLLDCVHWHADPDKLFPDYITQLAPNWYLASAKNANWTNNPHLIRTEWAKNILLPKLAGNIEIALQDWWQKTDYKVAQGEGLFTHDRVIKIRGIEMNLYPRERVSDDIRRNKDFFEASILDYIRDNYSNQKTIVDAGANIGNHTLYFANFLKFDSIHCFEPIEQNYKILESNARDPKIKLYKQALSSEKKTLMMQLGGRNMGSSMISDKGDIAVEAITLDSLNLEDVTLMKIDVEKHEPELLEGAKKTIARCHPLILIEDDTGEYGKLLPGYQREMYWSKNRTYLYKWNPEYQTFKVRGIELKMFTRDQLSDVIHRNNDFIEFDILGYIKEKYPVQKTIIDAGANIGNHAVYFANYLKYDSIHCFEPMPEVFKLLEINAKYPNVKLYQNALGHKNEILKMKFERRNTGGSRVKSNGDTEVEAITIDSLNLQDVTLLKIDVENSEEYVIKGAKETIERCHPLILMEDYRDGRWGEPLIQAGYVLEKVWPDKWTYLYRWVGKPYLIELYTRTPGCANYERTFPLVADSVRHLPIVLRTYRGHLHRWDHMPMTLGDNMCIFTDSADVIFQKPFPSLDPTKIYVANEGKTFEQNGVWRGLIRRYPQFEPMLPEIIYNVGSFACSGHLMKSWCDYLFSVRGRCHQNSIEQLWFNVWLRLPENKPLITEMPGLFTALYGNVEVGTAILKDGQFLTPEGIPYTVVHFNGNLKDIYHNILYNEK